MLNFIAWQMLVGVLPLTVLPFRDDAAGDAVERRLRALLLVWTGAVSTATGIPAVDRRAALPAGGNRIAQHVRHSR